MRRRIDAALGVALVVAGVGCGSPRDRTAPSAQAAAGDAGPIDAPTPPPLPPSAPPPSSADEDETSTRPLELLSHQLTSGVKARAPIDRLSRVEPGERVYVFLTVRNRSGRTRQVHVEFRVNGALRTVKDLDVAESWSFRTWAYNTVLETDKPGKLAVDVTDDEGHPLLEESLPITPR